MLSRLGDEYRNAGKTRFVSVGVDSWLKSVPGQARREELELESLAKPAHLAFGYEERAIGHVHHIVGADSQATGKREHTAGQERLCTGAVKRDLNNVVFGISSVNNIQIREQLRGIEVAIRPLAGACRRRIGELTLRFKQY